MAEQEIPLNADVLVFMCDTHKADLYPIKLNLNKEKKKRKKHKFTTLQDIAEMQYYTPTSMPETFVHEYFIRNRKATGKERKGKDRHRSGIKKIVLAHHKNGFLEKIPVKSLDGNKDYNFNLWKIKNDEKTFLEILNYLTKKGALEKFLQTAYFKDNMSYYVESLSEKNKSIGGRLNKDVLRKICNSSLVFAPSLIEFIENDKIKEIFFKETLKEEFELELEDDFKMMSLFERRKNFIKNYSKYTDEKKRDQDKKEIFEGLVNFFEKAKDISTKRNISLEKEYLGILEKKERELEEKEKSINSIIGVSKRDDRRLMTALEAKQRLVLKENETAIRRQSVVKEIGTFSDYKGKSLALRRKIIGKTDKDQEIKRRGERQRLRAEEWGFNPYIN